MNPRRRVNFIKENEAIKITLRIERQGFGEKTGISGVTEPQLFSLSDNFIERPEDAELDNLNLALILKGIQHSAQLPIELPHVSCRSVRIARMQRCFRYGS